MTVFFDLCHRVADDEIDGQGHVHNLRYLQWTLWAARDHAAACGWDSPRALQRDQIGWVVRDHQITYRASALAGDGVVVRTWVEELNRFASTRKYAICRPADRTVLARVSTRWVFVDLSRRKAIAIPREARAGLVLADSVPLPWEDTGRSTATFTGFQRPDSRISRRSIDGPAGGFESPTAGDS